MRVHPRYESLVTGVSLDSRTVEVGDLFFALCGVNADGRDYVNEAIQNGAVAVLCDGSAVPTHWACHDAKVPVFFVTHLSDTLGEIVNRFFKEPSKAMAMIGVTGTNGKTSCTSFISQALSRCGKPCAVIGTLGSGLASKLTPSVYTTPDAIQLQQQLAEFKQQQAQAVAMEVSSHGLAQGRVKGIAFDIGVFTNLSRDHLDYHKTLKNYFEAKKRLFSEYSLRYGVVNHDDDYGHQLIQDFSDRLTLYSYGLQTPSVGKSGKEIIATNIQIKQDKTIAKIQTPWGEGELHTNLMGRFNISNCLAVLTTLLLLEIPLDKALQAIAHLNPLPGRMQAIRKKQNPCVVVDFAHTPDALHHALHTLKEYQPKKLWCVFGCGGDRDQGKRPQMANVAERHADCIVVTSDNPRNEDPDAIIQDICAGFVNPDAIMRKSDRRQAIAYALSHAAEQDIVLIAGKGHENFQTIGAQQVPFSDAAVVKELLS